MTDKELIEETLVIEQEERHCYSKEYKEKNKPINKIKNFLGFKKDTKE